MKTLVKNKVDWLDLTNKLGKEFAERSSKHDVQGTFVSENYKELREHRFFSASIPKELGGGGVSHSEMCLIIKTMAQYCAATALSFSMHQHSIASALWKYKHENLNKEMLVNIAEHEIILVNTGARDWLDSNGELIRVQGGYYFSGTKHFASGSVGGDVIVTSGTYKDESGNWQVLHFSVPITTTGISVLNNWDVMGMRGTGSNSIVFEDAFIPDSAITLSRPRNEFHPFWNVVLTVALPLIMAVYLGVAEKGHAIAISKGKHYHRNQKHIAILIGRLHNAFLSAQIQWKEMCRYANNLEFEANKELTSDILSLKTNVSEQTKKSIEYAMEAIGGQSFFRSNILERLFRDVQASPFHPLPKWEQYNFTGMHILDKS